MSGEAPQKIPQRDSSRPFATTHWSVVLAAGHSSSPECRQALSALCESYWYPLYAYVRRRGHSVEEAQDLTQAFFAFLLEKDALRVADRERGRFRSFLLAALNNFLANEWRRAHAERRGGHRLQLALDFDSGERRYSLEPADETTPERIFERRWALVLLERAMDRLRRQYESGGKAALFAALKPYLGGGGEILSHEEVAKQLGVSAGSVKVAVHRLRRRCRETLRQEIAQTVGSPDEVDDELRALFTALGS